MPAFVAWATNWVYDQFQQYAADSNGRLTVERQTFTQPPGPRNPNLDFTCDAPGADDDASGVASVLELARVMSKHSFDATIIFAAFSGEEQGVFGSTFWNHQGQLHLRCARRRPRRQPQRGDLPGSRHLAQARAPGPPGVPRLVRENRAVARVLAIFGPTASGKTAVAEEVARRIPAELVSADAMQVYRGLPILTNQSEHPARLVGYLGLDEEGSVAEYQRLAHETVDEILAAGRTPVVVGGTGLYLRAALADLELPPPPLRGTRDRLERLYDEEGAEQAHALLAERDPEAAAAVHPNDRRRVVRALELAEAGSSLRPGKDTLWSGETRHPTRIFGLEVPPEELARRIEARTHEMFERGVEEEVARALSGPISATARTIHGLQDISELPREEAIEALVVRTRRYAAYQRKWMRRIPGLAVLHADRPPAAVAQEIVRELGSVAPAR